MKDSVIVVNAVVKPRAVRQPQLHFPDRAEVSAYYIDDSKETERNSPNWKLERATAVLFFLQFPVQRVSLCSLQIIAFKFVCQFCYCHKICPCLLREFRFVL